MAKQLSELQSEVECNLNRDHRWPQTLGQRFQVATKCYISRLNTVFHNMMYFQVNSITARQNVGWLLQLDISGSDCIVQMWQSLQASCVLAQWRLLSEVEVEQKHNISNTSLDEIKLCLSVNIFSVKEVTLTIASQTGWMLIHYLWLLLANVRLQNKYKEAGKREVSSSLYSLLPVTMETEHAKEASELLSEVQ